MPTSLSKMICNQHIVCLGTFIKRLASHLPNIIRRRLHDAGSPEAGAVMILPRRIGRAGKLGAATLLVQAL